MRQVLPSVVLLSLALLGCGRAGGGGSTVMSEAVVGCEDENFTPGPGDQDGDQLLDIDEAEGYEIQVDQLGLGTEASMLTTYRVTSSPTCPDTDGDGLSDRVEYLLRTDPRLTDTDGDGLGDRDEVLRWKTSPVSVDSDGDATGPDGLAPPNAMLFDGAELDFGTSPSLGDTDGDARTDFEEYDDPTRDPRLAELPSASFTFEGEVDIRLRVTYEDSTTSEVEYGETFTTTQSNRTVENRTDSSVLESESSASLFNNAGTLAASFLPSGDKSSKPGDAGASTQLRADPDGPQEIAIATAIAVTAGVVVAAAVADQLYCATAGKRDADGPVHFRQDDPQAADGKKTQSARDLNDTASSFLCYPKTTDSEVVEVTTESAESAQQSYSEYRRDSRTHTETVSSGSVRVGASVRNTGPTTVNIDDIFVTMMQWQPSVDPDAGIGGGTYKTLATLVPVIESVVLSPGEASPVFEMVADDVDPGIVKEFLARPGAIAYGPPGVALTDSHGLDFKYLTENTITQTATIVIDDGFGAPERFHVATNVNRTEDGELAGITMGEILEVLHLDYETELVDLTDEDTGETVGQVSVLTRIRDVAATAFQDVGDPAEGIARSPLGVWMVVTTRDDDWSEEIDFEDIVVRFGDNFHINYSRDEDGDGLFRREEALLGTSDDDAEIDVAGFPQAKGFDTDEDGLSDFVEARVGWEVVIDYGTVPEEETVSYRCTSNPRSADSDDDGWDDATEREHGTDPGNPDTDDDTIFDSDDPFPLVPAARLHVNAESAASAPDGTSWLTAYPTLYDALDHAKALNEDGDPQNDVSSIWVASGIYTPSAQGEPLTLLDGVSVFGGFGGTERVFADRNPDPVTNLCYLSGDLNGDDDGSVDPASPFRDDNALRVVDVPASVAFSRLGGFQIIGGAAVASAGGGLLVRGNLHLERCIVTHNTADVAARSPAGAGVAVSGGTLRASDCRIHGNRTLWGRGGGLSVGGTVELVDCTLDDNQALDGGGAAIVAHGRLTATNCALEDNMAYKPSASPTSGDADGGAVYVSGAGRLLVLDVCTMNRNVAGSSEDRRGGSGGGIFVYSGGTLRTATVDVRIDACEITGNVAHGRIDAVTQRSGIGGGLGTDSPFNAQSAYARISILNTVFADNASDTSYTDVDLGGFNEVSVVNSIVYANSATLRLGQGSNGATSPLRRVLHSCIQAPHVLGSQTVFTEDPLFMGAASGDFRLGASSPCVDAGTNGADVDPFAPGLQRLPETDAHGNPRIVDGTGDGQAVVDLGPYERQP